MSDNGQIRRSQAISTFGPGSLIDLPKESAIVGGLDCWPARSKLEEIVEPRLSLKLQTMTNVPSPKLYSPPADNSAPWEKGPGITAWRFPQWFVVQSRGDSSDDGKGPDRTRSRRLVKRGSLQQLRYGGVPAVATRFVRACRKGHVSDFNWMWFVHRGQDGCTGRPLWLDERGTGGDLGDLVVRCECGANRAMSEAMNFDEGAVPLGKCNGERPWLGKNAQEPCEQPARLLIRTATNAYFPQVVSVLSLPETRDPVDVAAEACWDELQNVKELDQLETLRGLLPKLQVGLAGFDSAGVLAAVKRRSSGTRRERSVKQAELEAILAAPQGYGDDVPMDEDFYARRLPDSVWRKSKTCDLIESVTQLHRLREVAAVTGFTRFSPMTPDIHGEYDDDFTPAQIALDPSWFPAVENRGEGVFIRLRSAAVKEWMDRDAVKSRVGDLERGHEIWTERRGGGGQKEFVGGEYILLHTLSHLVLQSLALSCGYPASSIRERIYVEGGSFGFLLYTGTPDADGTLGGLVQEARHIDRHLREALRMAALCSNDPICAQHDCGRSMEGRWLQGAACHGCGFIAETSCEMRNDYLDRALVVPVLGKADAAFFPRVE